MTDLRKLDSIEKIEAEIESEKLKARELRKASYSNADTNIYEDIAMSDIYGRIALLENMIENIKLGLV